MYDRTVESVWVWPPCSISPLLRVLLPSSRDVASCRFTSHHTELCGLSPLTTTLLELLPLYRYNWVQGKCFQVAGILIHWVHNLKYRTVNCSGDTVYVANFLLELVIWSTKILLPVTHQAVKRPAKNFWKVNLGTGVGRFLYCWKQDWYYLLSFQHSASCFYLIMESSCKWGSRYQKKRAINDHIFYT